MGSRGAVKNAGAGSVGGLEGFLFKSCHGGVLSVIGFGVLQSSVNSEQSSVAELCVFELELTIL